MSWIITVELKCILCFSSQLTSEEFLCCQTVCPPCGITSSTRVDDIPSQPGVAVIFTEIYLQLRQHYLLISPVPVSRARNDASHDKQSLKFHITFHPFLKKLFLHVFILPSSPMLMDFMLTIFMSQFAFHHLADWVLIPFSYCHPVLCRLLLAADVGYSVFYNDPCSLRRTHVSKLIIQYRPDGGWFMY